MAENKHVELIKTIENKLDDHVQELKEDLTKAILAYLEKTENAYDLSNIKWQPAEGPSGPYERSEDVDNLDFKALHKDLVKHGGKLTRNGWFIWLFKNGTTIGRKKRK